MPVGPPSGQVGPADEAPLNMPLATGLGQAGFDLLPDVWFGNTRGTNIQFSVSGRFFATCGSRHKNAVGSITWVEPEHATVIIKRCILQIVFEVIHVVQKHNAI